MQKEIEDCTTTDTGSISKSDFDAGTFLQRKAVFSKEQQSIAHEMINY